MLLKNTTKVSLISGGLTEGIKSPDVFAQTFLLPKGRVIQAVVCETVHSSYGSLDDWESHDVTYIVLILNGEVSITWPF